jgi:medium-chain acyl-[acyl-carrier-protein] hydrolase
VSTRWLVRTRIRPHARLRLVCFAHGGGGASVFADWPALFPDWIEVCAVQLPGRENRRGEPCLTDLGEVVEALGRILPAELEAPWVGFGHCVGARVLYELARRLRDAGGPRHLFLSSHGAPGAPPFPGRPGHLMSDAELLATLRAAGTTSEEVLGSERALAWLLPLLRADAALTEATPWTPGPPLEVPIPVTGGDADPWVAPAALAGWRAETQAGFRVRTFPGGHFYLREHAAELAAVICRELIRSRAAQSVEWCYRRRRTSH